MIRPPLMLLLTITAFMTAAHAQGVYKTVGPDGKIVYTDRPPENAGAKVESVRVPSAAPQPSPTRATATAPSASGDMPVPRNAGAKKATGARVASADSAASAAAPYDPRMEAAIFRVLGMEDLVQRTRELCVATLPTSFSRYDRSAEAWSTRHATVVTQARRALSDKVDATQRQRIESGIQAKTDQMLARVTDAPTASRIRWCDQSTDEIGKGKLDLRDAPGLASVLASNR